MTGRIASDPKDAVLPEMTDAPNKQTRAAALVVGDDPTLASRIAAGFWSQDIPVAVIDRTGAMVGETRIGTWQGPVDPCDPEELGRLVAAVKRDLPRIGYLVHLSSTSGTDSILDTSLEQFDRIVDEGLTAAFVTAQIVASEIAHGGGGSIVMVSRTEVGVIPGSMAIAKACQAAITQLVRIMTVDLAADNIRVNALITNDPMDDDAIDALAAATIFLACDEPSYVNGQILVAGLPAECGAP